MDDITFLQTAESSEGARTSDAKSVIRSVMVRLFMVVMMMKMMKMMKMIIRWINANVDLPWLDLTSLRGTSILWWIVWKRQYLLQQDNMDVKTVHYLFQSVFFGIRKVRLFIEDKWICLLDTCLSECVKQMLRLLKPTFLTSLVYNWFRAYNPHGKIKKGIKSQKSNWWYCFGYWFSRTMTRSKSIRQPKTTVISYNCCMTILSILSWYMGVFDLGRD